MPRRVKFPMVVGVRLSPADGKKLQHLCAATQRVPSELLRLLVRLAEPTDLPAIHFVQGHGQEGAALATQPQDEGVLVGSE